MKRELICIICPKGCPLKADIQGEGVLVQGNACPKGEIYAVDECLHPTRAVTSVVRVSNRKDTMVSVKTEQPIPKEKIFEVMERIRQMQVCAPIAMGEAVCQSFFGTKLIATKQIP